MQALRYQGTKRKIAGWVLDRLPQARTFVDLFGGGAAISVAARRSRAYQSVVYNDLDGGVVNFFECLRDCPDDLIAAIDMTPYSRAEFERCRDQPDAPDRVERARRFFTRHYQSFRAFGTAFQINCRPAPTTDAGGEVNAWGRLPGRLSALARAVKGIAIESNDALRLVEMYDAPGVLLYADPPYFDTASGYSVEFSEADHGALARALSDCSSRAAVSGYRSDLYDSLYADWDRHDVALTSGLGATGARARVESLWVKDTGDRAQTDLFR